MIDGRSIESQRPQAVTYQIVNREDDFEMLFGSFSDISNGVQNIDNYGTIGREAAGGTLTINQSTDEWIKGSFEFITFNEFSGGNRITVKGEFSAEVLQ